MSEKKKYRIPVSWEMMGWIEVEADSLQDAVSHCYGSECPLPEGDYIDGTFKVDNEDGQILAEDYPEETIDFNNVYSEGR